MKIQTMVVGLLALALLPLSGRATGKACHFNEKAKFEKNLEDYVNYPTDGGLIKEMCQRETKLTKREQRCLERKLPDQKIYRSSDEVRKDLGIKKS